MTKVVNLQAQRQAVTKAVSPSAKRVLLSIADGASVGASSGITLTLGILVVQAGGWGWGLFFIAAAIGNLVFSFMRYYGLSY